MNLALLFGLHLLSLLIAAAILLEYRRVRREQATLLALLGGTNDRSVTSVMLTVGYVLTLLLFAGASAAVYFLLPA